ncbi:MAG: trypsin-like peptidase domain-containing protein [Acidobacteria bacterium]|nr:trypsin-like peptidase domain-containing protein [Acidobacteriota bacterium]
MRKHAIALLAVLLILGSAVALVALVRSQGQALAATSSTIVDQRPAATTGTLDSGEPIDTHLFRNIVKRENPVVVSITTESRVRPSQTDNSFGPDDFFGRFFGAPPARSRIEVALGSGFIISPDGEILTNNHVVAGADEIKVGLLSDDGKTYSAKVVGRDPLTDSALIKLEDGPGNLPAADLGDSDAIEPGDWVVAIGNPFNLGHTVTVGVISYKARPFAVTEGRFQNMLQTDASINPGNSGGPLIDVNGAVVGINSAILAGDGGSGNIGIGFAVPINTVKALLPQLRQGRVHRGQLGVQIQSAPITDDEARALKLPKPEGAIVAMVEQDSPAGRGGLRAGDVVVEFNGHPVADGAALTTMVVGTAAGTKVPIVFYRNGERQTTTVTIQELALKDENQAGGGAGGSSAEGFGLSLGDLTPQIAQQLRLPSGAEGALVENVQPLSPAAGAGLRRGDVIQEVNGQAVHSSGEAARTLGGVKSGQPAFLLVMRQGNQVLVEVRRQ